MAAIEIRGLGKTYKTGFLKNREKVALKDLSLTVEEGEVFGCLGPTGAGKSTTLKILMGLIFATQGSATILGRALGDPAMKLQIGYLPEVPYFYDYLTARELVEYYAALSEVPARNRRRRSDEVLELAGLKDAKDIQLRKFSKGMLQRAGIAQAIVHDPKLVFLDEPMSGLDPIGRRELRELIQHLNDSGKTIFFSTHILSDAEALCDRVCVLNKGELRGIGAVAELVSQAQGKVEITWEGVVEIAAIRALAGQYRVAGNSARAVVAESESYRVIEVLRNAQARLISVTPVHSGLEEYFLSKVEGTTPVTAEAQP